MGKTNKKECKPLLRPNGVYRNVKSRYASETKAQLELLKKLFEQGDYQAVIDKIFPMDKIVEAHKYVDTGRKKRNVVIKISE